MTIIDLKTNTSYPLLSVSQAAKIVGVDESTIYRWKKLRAKENYNSFLIVFIEIKQNKP